MLQNNNKYYTWLRQFLHLRGLIAPDQRGLYAYHCNHEEYISLQFLLSDPNDFGKDLNDNSACACFVLFGSEWYRREYRSLYGWSWDPIWKALGHSIGALEISKVVPRGLESYWKRPLHLYEAGRRDFLGSLFSEGGLPFQVLREDGSRFQSLFDKLLTNHEQFHLLGVSTLLQVEQQLERTNLPQVFSTRPSLELIAQMVDELVAYVRNYGLAQVSEPVGHLDSLHPNWRASFPLPLDNDTGSEFLNALLKTATIEGKKSRRGSTGWACRHFWQETQPNELTVQISLPDQISLRLTDEPSTTRFELAIMEDGKIIASLGPCYARVENRNAHIRLPVREAVGKRLDCRVQLYLVAMAGGIQITSLPIERSAVALAEVPLGFEPTNDRWELCGQASFNVTTHDLMLVLPEKSQINIIDSEISSSLSEMPSAFALRTVKANGKAQIQVISDESYRIRMGQKAQIESALEFAGKQIEWITKPAITFIGLPKVQWPAGSGDIQRQHCNLYVGGKLPGSGVLQETLGAQFVSARSQDGDTLIRRRVGILPTDFQIDLRSGDSPNQGSIFIFTKQRCLFQISDRNIQVKQERYPDHIELKLIASDFPPAWIHLSVTPSLLADPVVIDLPFPGSGCLAYDGNGQKLKSNLSVDDLLGARFFLFGKSGAPTRFCIELTLQGNVARNAHYSWVYLVGVKPLEVSIYNFREQIIDLLSLQSGIDQVISLRVFSASQDTVYRIRRYAMEMQLDKQYQLLRTDISLLDSDSIPEPVLMLLHDPMRNSIPIESRQSEGVPTADFELPPVIEKDGPWLVLPKVESKVSFRPVFIRGSWQPPAETEVIHSLQKAVLHFDHESPVSSFTSVLDAMATNPAHSGWQFLRALYDEYGYLPLATFEVWKALVGHTPALVLALFRFEMDAKFLARLESEFPIFWELIPISQIQCATRYFADYLKAKGVADEAVNGVLKRMLSRLSETFPTYGQNVQNFLIKDCVGPEVNLPVYVFQSILDGWYHELIRERSDATWPNFGGNRLKQWYSRQRDSVILLPTEMDYRNSVLYLPIFAAAVASGKSQFSDVFTDGAQAIFFLRQVRDFDSKWFNSVYQYCLLNNVMSMQKGASVIG